MTENNGTSPFFMPVAPAYNNGGGNGGFGFGGDSGAWWLLILLIALGGWGNGFGGGFGGGGGGGFYPMMMANNDVQRGFDQSAVINGINGVQNAVTTGFGNVQTALCNGFAGVANGFAQAEIAANARQIADLQQNFAAQTAITAGLTGLQSQFAQCCCDNRAGLADLRYTVATENCADRAAVADGIRDVIAATQTQTQVILDRLTQDKLDEKNETIAQLRQELMFARNQASQDVQTAAIRAGQVAEVDALYDRLSNCPVSTVPVYGRQPIFSCPQSAGGCGCGM